MPKHLEVRAVTTFGRFRIGRVYEVDIEDQSIMSLLGVGYLEPTSDLEDDDELGATAGMDLPGATVGVDLRDVRVVGSPESSEGVADGADSVGQVGDTARRASARVRGRKAAGVQDADRGADSGEVGNTSSRVRSPGRWANTES
jgi:hypothetical protein